MTPNEKLIVNFYEALQVRNAELMSRCYHSDATFEDPAFGKLYGDEISSMWDMLCSRGKDLKIEFSDIKETDGCVSAQCKARYTFSASGRQVYNIIHAKFEFSEGKILNHIDTFDLWRWSRQALGLKGWLLGWSTFFKTQLQKQTRSILKKYSEAQPLKIQAN